MYTPNEYPQYLIIIGGSQCFFSLEQAYVAFGRTDTHVAFGDFVLLIDHSLRPMTDEDRRMISNGADALCDKK